MKISELLYNSVFWHFLMILAHLGPNRIPCNCMNLAEGERTEACMKDVWGTCLWYSRPCHVWVSVQNNLLMLMLANWGQFGPIKPIKSNTERSKVKQHVQTIRHRSQVTWSHLIWVDDGSFESCGSAAQTMFYFALPQTNTQFSLIRYFNISSGF